MGFLKKFSNKIEREAVFRADGRTLIKLCHEATNVQFIRKTNPVLFFNASTRLEGISQNAAFSILSSLGVRAQGIPVVHFVCMSGMSRCVLGTNRTDITREPPCQKCMAQSNRMFSDIDRFEFHYERDRGLEHALDGKHLDQLENTEYQDLPVGQLVLPSLRWVLRKHHLIDDDATRFLYREFILSAWNVARNFQKVFEKYNPRTVVVFNGQFFPEATARYIALQKSIRVITHEVALQPFTCYFTDGEATAYPIDIPPSFELKDSQNKKLDEYLEQRFQGNFSMAGIRFWPEMQNLGEGFWKRASQYKQIVPIFTNVVFDTSQGHANVIFPDMFSWLDLTLQIIKHHPETFFVIRAHPDEGRKGKESQESVVEWAQKNQIDQLENVLFVDSGEPFSSYELIQKSKFVMAYNSTIGLEAAILGLPVLCGGKARFTQLKTVFLPKDHVDFESTAEEFLKSEKIIVPLEFQQNARRFLYYQLFRTSIPFGDFLTPDNQWRGYVHLKKIKLQDLSPENSAGMKTVLDGILMHKPFLLEE
jgi:hypothetical protein